MNEKKIILNTNICFHRESEDNWNIQRELKDITSIESEEILYLGYEVEMNIDIYEDFSIKVIKINGIDVSDKNIINI